MMINSIFEIISKFFPFKSAFHSDENTFTFWVVVSLICYFTSSILYLHFKFQPIMKLLKNLSIDFNINIIKKDKILNNLWVDYQNTFHIEINNKTDIDASQFFNGQNIVDERINLRYWMDLPNVFVGLGILGTFLGLSFAISDFDMKNIELSIENMLAGMGTAFLTSLYGILFSILFKFFEKNVFNKISNATTSFCKQLNKRFKITKEDEFYYYQRQEKNKIDLLTTKISHIINTNLEKTLQTQQNTLERFLTYKTKDNKTIYIGNILFYLYQSAKQQENSLKSFSGDLADGIKISSMTIEAFGQAIQDSMSDAMNNRLAPIMEKIEIALKDLENQILQLKETKEESSANVISNILEDLKSAIANMFSDIQKGFTGATQTHMENLASNLNIASNSLQQFPEQLDSMLKNLNILIEKQQKQMQDSNQAINQTSHKAVAIMGTQVKQAAGYFNGSITEIKELLASYKNVFNDNNQLSENIKGSISSIVQVQNNMTNLSKQLLEYSNILQKSGNDFYNNNLQLINSNKDFLTENQKSLNNIKEKLDEARHLSKSYSEEFNHIKLGLQNIFQNIETGLNEYGNITRGQLNDYLSQFSNHLTDAASALSGSVEALRDPLEDLIDAIDRNGNKHK